MNGLLQDTRELPLDGLADQFRLTRIQTFNWGTFGGVFDFLIPEEGYLFVGPSGSGKSTVLDAHAALLTPPKWVDFNVAAREAERHGKDRNVMTYVRGAWAQQTGDNGEYVSQYLRSDTTWSVIAETYRNGHGRWVVLAQVLWVRGKSTAATDVKKLYLVLQREFEIHELEFFPKNEFDVRRFKHDLPDAFVNSEFSVYQERFRNLLGIDNERALRLLHKTQSAKNLGDLNVFLRDFMLDAPETFAVADRLVLEFGELNAAHQAVVAARKQIETLLPAQEEHQARERCGHARNELAEVSQGVDHYREQRRKALLDERIIELQTDAEGSRQKVEALGHIVDNEFEKLKGLKTRQADMGGNLLEQLQRDIDEAEKQKPERMRKRELAAAACRAMGWAFPDEVVWFVQRVETARQTVLKASQRSADLEIRKDDIKRRKDGLTREFESTVLEVRAMERQRSNIPSRLLEVRRKLALDLGLPEEKLPFVGELLEVKQDSALWQGSIERVLGGFARSVLVDDKHYAAVSAYLNDHNIGERLFYNRVLQQTAAPRAPGPNSLVRKLNIAIGPYADWLREELKAHFDFECAETVQAFRAAHRAVTREGQVKHNTTRHEKNDRQRVDDRSSWVLGFDNKAKLTLFQDKAAELGGEISKLANELEKVNDEGKLQRAQDMHCNTLQNMTWAEVDVASLVTRVADLKKQVEQEKAARPDLAKMDENVKNQDKVYSSAVLAQNKEAAKGLDIGRQLAQCEGKLLEVARLYPHVAVTPVQRDALDMRFTKTAKEVTIESLDQVTTLVVRGLGAEERALELQMNDLRNNIERRFADFNRAWLAEAGGLDPTLASAEDYFGKLARLQTDRLPEYEQRFLQLLREQSDQNLTLLSTRLEQERSAIRARMELVNESLLTAPFNKGTHLVIETLDRTLEEVRAFKQSLKDALSHSFSAEQQVTEHRFAVLSALVKRLGSQETADRNWRAVVLDVRQHVEFVARELDELDAEVEVYRSGAGKSGGQRQKLAATCLAAALRYQLGGQDRALPSFSTVVLDEAFDKADAEFTAMAMNIFKTFGFQMVVATPLKSVMTLEPFIGGACFVHIKDRKNSAVLKIDYDKETQRLKLPEHVRNVQEAVVS
ncbi:MAG: ATP-binding protein [Burkholderiales bacterium]|jgi:uncharacterized protein YPO0396|uniref:ATP-binding protein n=1 Tax=Polaromonas sp. TaxID=1869339 RepID=UPI00334A720E|nr:ATP-binding protein [Burkholderiales bacterium]